MTKKKAYLLDDDGYYDPDIGTTAALAYPVVKRGVRKGYRVVESGFETAFGLDLNKILTQIALIEGIYIVASIAWRTIRLGQAATQWFSTTGGWYAVYETPIGNQTLLCVLGDALGLKRVGDKTQTPAMSAEYILDLFFINYFYYVLVGIPIIVFGLNWWSASRKKKKAGLILE
jgi:hypothetical protein